MLFREGSPMSVTWSKPAGSTHNDEHLQQDVFTEAQAARFLAISPSTLRSWRAQGCGPTYYLCGTKLIRYERASLDEFILQRSVRPSKPAPTVTANAETFEPSDRSPTQHPAPFEWYEKRPRRKPWIQDASS